MGMTTIKISGDLRDQLAGVARDDYGGATLADTLLRLLAEHEERAILAAYDRLRADEDEWAAYRDESHLTDQLAGDWAHRDRAE